MKPEEQDHHYSQVNEARRMALALFDMGLDPGPVSAMLSDVLTPQRVKTLHKKANAQRPKSGTKPNGREWWVRNDLNRLHASVFLGYCAQVMKEFNASVEVFLRAYERYCIWAGPQPLVEARRAYYLMSQYNTQRIVFVKCQECQASSIADRWERFSPSEQCPMCAIEARQSKMKNGNCSVTSPNAGIQGQISLAESVHGHMDQQTTRTRKQA